MIAPLMGSAPSLDVRATIQAPAGTVLRAFFEADALGAWWQAAHSVTTPRALGPYAIEWAPTDFRDEMLGRLGGVFRGTVMEFDAGAGFFVADAYWLPPDGDPIGPMALAVQCTSSDDGATQVRVRQTGFEEGERWRRYYEVIAHGWERALASMKALLEK
ncbi:MAG: SRPBCC domain-containing protein [Acidobacteria bacterium]|nr:SRPBCC domain-containing protein [Acidobacteriota bacterium]